MSRQVGEELVVRKQGQPRQLNVADSGLDFLSEYLSHLGLANILL